MEFWPKRSIFGQKQPFFCHFFKKIAVVRYVFPLPEGHIGRWSRQEYSRGPLETFIPSFTRQILAAEPTKWMFGQKRSIFSQEQPFLGQNSKK